jgi:hypothetical protein
MINWTKNGLWSFLVGIFAFALAFCLASDAQMHARHEGSNLVGNLPLSFESNEGQYSPPIRFAARGPGYSVELLPDGADLIFQRPASQVRSGPDQEIDRIHIGLDRPSAALRVEGVNELPGKVNYFVGHDPAQWHTGIPTVPG